MQTIESALEEACQDLNLPPAAQAQMAAHWRLMVQWNGRTNLTSIHDPVDGAWLHYRDSLVGLIHLNSGPVVDFGSGAGFPGMVLAMAKPDWQFCLVEPRRKRVSFLETAVARLGLKNVQVFGGKLEDPPPHKFAHAVTRATFADAPLRQAAATWLTAGATLLAWRAAGAQVAAHSQLYAYQLRGQARQIEICQFV